MKEMEPAALPCTSEPELFFPISERANWGDIKRAQEMCGRCAVKAVCLGEALESNIPDGIWGGVTEWDRKRATQRPQLMRQLLAEAVLPSQLRAQKSQPAPTAPQSSLSNMLSPERTERPPETTAA